MKEFIAIVENSRCHPNKCSHECMKYDPLNKSGKLVGFHLSEKTEKAEIAEELVTEMHKISSKKCPFGAIHIAKVPTELKEDPIHKFGSNAFRLYALPIAKQNTVVGIIGRNGIGKSTALQILANLFKPNLGKYQNPPANEEIIQRYSTTWLGGYFKKLFKNEIKLAYKPQRVEFLNNLYKGKTVKLVLAQYDQTKVSHIINELELETLLERQIQELSGGELQRLAIAATLLKKCEVAFFDEPSTFLDITFRIKVAKLIREYAKNKAVIIVEHDLATLDYVCDEIQVVYGLPACYGVFSQSKSVRRGINEYLDGFLPDENMRFRSYPIKFTEAQVDMGAKKYPLVTIPSLKKTLGTFSATTVDCTLHAGEVYTIMGANGLGKTTFLKMLIGEITEENTSFKLEKVSYKPQYLENNMEGTVEQYLRKHASSSWDSGWYKTNILEKLNIQGILHNEIKQLSGGELQKLHIAAALSKECQVLIMDEPSAYIDVEDRLHVAEVIREFVSKKEIAAIIVDHDIQFLDFLSDSMLVFEGKPGIQGAVFGPFTKLEGMNRVLKNLDITYRRDRESLRPRINKPGSQLDREQRAKGEYYYL
ncbi:ribosome biogenesis/translation initiation ATPase RLI [Candidatus Woesearchaeota archaeon]|nr:ribosome biogenesis/translation initiation ATPase RLI [Candidatus Woesearchaeota archaeon]